MIIELKMKPTAKRENHLGNIMCKIKIEVEEKELND